MILLETVVLSKLRKARPNPKVAAWLRGLRESDVFLSVVTLGAIGVAVFDTFKNPA